MGQDIYAGSLGRQRLTGAANGVALTTTPAFTGLIKGTEYVDLIPRNFATAVVMRYIECPYLIVLKTKDSLGSRPRDNSEVAQDGSTATSVDMGLMDTAANGDFLYVGATTLFRGVNIDVDATNSSGSSVLTVRYRTTSNTWADITDSDGTETGGRSLAQDGSVTWTVPTDWKITSLKEAGDTTLIFPYAIRDLYWTRWEWSAAFADATVTLDHMLGINESTTYAEVPVGVGTGMRVHEGEPGGISGYEMLTDAGTGNCLITCSTLNKGRFTTGTVL